jgi:N6-adenosine-specific RNA methylase IME4
MEKYSVIYATPPWLYNKVHISYINQTEEIPSNSPAQEKIPLETILSLPVDKITCDDAVLFLWATTPILEDAFKVMHAWGFSYKTLFTWEKTDARCLGYWFKTCTEHLIIATKGNVKAFGSKARNCYHARKLRHGKKPDYFYQLIEKVTSGKRLELFTLEDRPGWDAWDDNQAFVEPFLSNAEDVPPEENNTPPPQETEIIQAL